MKLCFIILLCVLCNVTAQLALKSGSSTSSSPLYEHPGQISSWVTVLTSTPVLLGILLWCISTLLWIYVLSGHELSFAYALYSLNYVLTPLAASWYFKESLNSQQTWGIAFIVLGVGLTVSGRLGS